MEIPKRLFMIDDDVDDLDFFREAVSIIDPSIICIQSTDSSASLESFKNSDVPVPDMIFLDLNMPLIDGRTFLKEIKSLRSYAHIPVVIYSTSSHSRDIEDTRNLGAAYFLTKPNSMKELIEGLKPLLSDWYIDHRQIVSFHH